MEGSLLFTRQSFLKVLSRFHQVRPKCRSAEQTPTVLPCLERLRLFWGCSDVSTETGGSLMSSQAPAANNKTAATVQANQISFRHHGPHAGVGCLRARTVDVYSPQNE